MSSIYCRPQRSYRQEVEKGTRRKGRRSRSAGLESRFGQSSTRPILPQWIRRWALVVLLLGFVGLLVVLMRPWKTTAAAASTWKAPKDPGSALILPEEDPATATWQGLRPIDVARAFTAATTHSERLQWVDHPEEVAALMEEFYTHGPGRTEIITGLSAMRIPMQDGRAFDSFQVTLADGSSRLLDVAYELNGHAKVDFKSYSRYCGTPWTTLLDGSRPSASEMRDLPDREMRYTVGIQNTESGWQHRQFILSKVLRSGWLGH